MQERMCRTMGCGARFEADGARNGTVRWCSGAVPHPQEWRDGFWMRVDRGSPSETTGATTARRTAQIPRG
jgi:hypothetical protein